MGFHKIHLYFLRSSIHSPMQFFHMLIAV
jgi:nucleolysin TIA-1/TIAR